MEKMSDEALMAQIDQFANQFNGLVKDMLSRRLTAENGSEAKMFDPEKYSSLLKAAVDIDTSKLIEAQMDFMEKQILLWQSATRSMAGEKSEPLITEKKGDHRFQERDWSENSVFNYLKQAYLLNSQMLEATVDAIKFADANSELQAKFFTRQYINSMSPSNYVLTNPEVFREIFKSEGKNLVKGADNFLRDLEQSSPDAFKITQTDPNAFKLGENIATTPGKVIFQNDLIPVSYTHLTLPTRLSVIVSVGSVPFNTKTQNTIL